MEEQQEFLLDAVSVGGSSGSPVFRKNTSTLLGLILGHIPVAGQNAYLARALGVHHVKSLIEDVIAKFT